MPGPSERSFGIHVARLAGIPESVLKRAKDILLALEEEGARRVSDVTEGGAQVGGCPTPGRENAAPSPSRGSRAKQGGQLMLFDAPGEADPAIRKIIDTLKALNTNTMTPVQALTLLDELVRKARGV